jgi:sulfur-carrier protein adenylyltransferase/sulfurtransferase
MSTTIHIPTALRQLTAGKSEVVVEAKTAGEALDQLTIQHPGLKKHLFNEQNTLRNFVNVYLNNEDIRYQSGVNTPVAAGDSISIVPSIAGGSQGSTVKLEQRRTGELPELSNEEIIRYGRHLILPEIGIEGQRKLKNARVLMVGTGGLGAPLGMYLAAAGIGHIGLVDFDTVDPSNLQRQIIHGTRDVGRPKIESAEDRLHDINPNVRIETYETRLSSENALEIMHEYDVVVDGTDNFPTRYLVNDACVLLGKPNVYGSIFRFEGQASVFWAEKGACYRCLYSEPPPPGLVPSCAEGGVLGVLPGIIGTIQANEAIKLILGAGEPLINRLLLFDAWKLQFRELKLRKNPECPICGEHPTIHELIDYEAFCGLNIPDDPSNKSDINEITAVEFKQWIDKGLSLQIIDVREPHEHAIAKIPAAKLIPLGQITDRVSDINPSQSTVVFCKSGIRSAKAIGRLKEIGFKGQLINLKGGITAWSNDVDRSVPKY